MDREVETNLKFHSLNRHFYSCSMEKMGTTRYCGLHSILTDDGGPVWERKKYVENLEILLLWSQFAGRIYPCIFH